MDFVILDQPSDLADRAADIVQSEIESSHTVALGLAGGSTPRATYEALASRSIDWSATTAWMTDERWVPPTSADANQRMVRAALVSATSVPFLTPDTTLASPQIAAAAFTESLLPTLRSTTRRVTLLGIGTDGHTASLFPCTGALDVDEACYVDNFVPSLDVWRLTATVGLLAWSDVVIFLVAGASKASTIAAIASGGDVPAARIVARERVVWLLDAAAASEMT